MEDRKGVGVKLGGDKKRCHVVSQLAELAQKDVDKD